MNVLKHFGIVVIVCSLLLVLPTNTPAAEHTTGIVVLHGKWGSPHQQISSFAAGLRDAGFLVLTPEMPWSGRRLYDTGIDGAMTEIDRAVATLRSQGAKKIVVAGHSLGAMAVLRYCGSRQVDGLMLLAPGHSPEGKGFRQKTADDVAKAQELVSNGKPDSLIRVSDLNNGGRRKDIMTTARIYLDYFDPNGPMNSRNNGGLIRPGIPVLWIVGSHEEEGLRLSGEKIKESFAPDTNMTVRTVDADHLQTPYYALTPAIDWLTALMTSQP